MASCPHVQVMTRCGCGLCDDVKEVVRQAADQGLCTWESVDVDRDKALLIRYGMNVPVVLVNGRERRERHIDLNGLRSALGEGAC